MPPKPDASIPVEIVLRVTGGEIAGGSTLAPRVGPLGLSAKKIGEDIAKTTIGYKGLKVTVKLIVVNRQAQIEVLPSASTLLIKALNEPARDKKKVKNIKHSGNLELNDIYNITRQLQYKMLAKDFKAAVKEILGTANSIGCTVNTAKPTDIIADINSNKIVLPDE